MPRTKIDEQSVFAVCDRIFIETGRDPSYQDITDELGGSNSTVKPFIQSWLDQPRPARQPMPDTLQTTVASFVQVIWGHALATSQKAMLPVIRETEDAHKRSQGQLASAMQTISEVDQERDGLKVEIQRLMATNAELHFKLGANDTLTKRCEGLEQTIEVLSQEREQALAQISGAQGQIDALERQLVNILGSIKSPPKSSRKRSQISTIRAGKTPA